MATTTVNGITLEYEIKTREEGSQEDGQEEIKCWRENEK